MNKAIFLDKDGTVIKNIPYNKNVNLITLEDHALESLGKLKNAGYLLIVITNQSGIARGFFNESVMNAMRNKINKLLQPSIEKLDGFYYCPHLENGVVKKYSKKCNCRKPNPGLIFQAALDHDIDISQSWLIGDSTTDIEAGNRAGCRTILIHKLKEKISFSKISNPEFTVGDLNEAVFHVIDHPQELPVIR